MICNDCKSFVNELCQVMGNMRDGELDCPLEEWLRVRDNVNASDRGVVKYMCDEGVESDECLYGTDHESDCFILQEGTHPRDCEYARLKVSEIEGETP